MPITVSRSRLFIEELPECSRAEEVEEAELDIAQIGYVMSHGTIMLLVSNLCKRK
jgi:hypothetical protein